MPGLLKVGELPPLTRSRGRKPGKWRGHEKEAQELRDLAKLAPGNYGLVLTGVVTSKAQAVARSIKRGEAFDFPADSTGHYEAFARKSPSQDAAPYDDKTGKTRTLFDVWARYVPSS